MPMSQDGGGGGGGRLSYALTALRIVFFANVAVFTVLSVQSATTGR